MNTCQNILTQCYEPNQCPPLVMQVLASNAIYTGFMPTFDDRDMACDVGPELEQLSGACCPPDTEKCDVIKAVLNKAMAKVYTEISLQGYALPLQIGKIPLFDSNDVNPVDFEPGTPKHSVYWLLREYVMVVARYAMYRDAAIDGRDKPMFAIRYEDLEKKIADGLKLPANLLKVSTKNTSSFGVAGRPASPLKNLGNTPLNIGGKTCC
jgi:hypothetical protein